MSDQTADLEAWNARYDAAIEAGADPAEAVKRADSATPRRVSRSQPPPSGVPIQYSPPKLVRVIDPEEERRKQQRKEFERWNAANEAQRTRLLAGLAHEEAVKEARRREFYEAQKEAANEKAQPKIVKQHRSLDEP